MANNFNTELAKAQLPDVFADALYTKYHFTLEPFRNSYFARDWIFTSSTGSHTESLKKGNSISILLLFVPGIFILAISCINVMNLSTARSARRSREIAVRKVMGADRRRLVSQFLIESILLSILSLILALSAFSLAESSPDKNKSQKVQAHVLLVDPDFFDLYGVSLAGGETFIPNSDKQDKLCIINQAARRALAPGISILGKMLHQGTESHRRIIGVAEDFYFFYPWLPIEPLVMTPEESYPGLQRAYISVRLVPQRHRQTEEKIQMTTRRYFPDSGTFLSVADEIERIRDAVRYNWGSILRFASVVSIILATLGIFGFAEYETERKTKEIGIRKALGATRLEICLTFCYQFVPIILLANIIAWGFSLLWIPKVLYFIDYPRSFFMGLPVFMYSCSVTLLITLLTVGF